MHQLFGNKSLFLSIFVCLIFISSFVAAAGVDVKVTPSQAEGFSGSVTKYAVTVKNMENKADSFLLSYSGTFSSWITLDKNIVVLPVGGEETIYLSVNPPVGINPSVYRYIVRADSANDPAVFGNAEFFFTVYFKYPIVIKGFRLDATSYNPGSDVNAITKVANLAVTDLEGFSLDITITDPLSKQSGITIPVGASGLEEKTVQKIIPLDRHAIAGNYKALAQLRSQSGEPVSQNQTSFVVNSFYNVVQSKDEQKTSSGKTITIKLLNDGNMIGRNLTVREDLSSVVAWLAAPDTKPTRMVSSGGDVSYFWIVDELKPGESATFVYRISYTPAYVILAFLIVGAVVIFVQMQKPKVFKRILHSGPAQIGKEFTVTIGVKNSSRDTLRSAIVRDLIPVVMRLLPHHETLKPLVKKTALGTEMIWKIGDLKPQEERIITYKLSPVMGVLGTISLPKAYLRYRDADENSIKIDSNYAELGEVVRQRREE